MWIDDGCVVERLDDVGEVLKRWAAFYGEIAGVWAMQDAKIK